MTKEQATESFWLAYAKWQARRAFTRTQRMTEDQVTCLQGREEDEMFTHSEVPDTLREWVERC